MCIILLLIIVMVAMLWNFVSSYRNWESCLIGLSTIDYPPFLHFLDCFVFVIIHLMNSNGGRVSHKMAFGMYD